MLLAAFVDQPHCLAFGRPLAKQVEHPAMAFVDNTERAFVAIFVDISCKGGNLADASQLNEGGVDPINGREVWKALADMPNNFK